MLANSDNGRLTMEKTPGRAQLILFCPVHGACRGGGRRPGVDAGLPCPLPTKLRCVYPEKPPAPALHSQLFLHAFFVYNVTYLSTISYLLYLIASPFMKTP